MAEENKPKPQFEDEGESASRARNRTVMLTPEITGQVRARLQQEIVTPDSEFTTPTSVNSGARAPRVDLQPQHRPAPPAQQPQHHAEPVRQVQKTRLVGFLVSYDQDPMGEYYELRTGRMIITSERVSTGNHLVIDHETISPMHAILRVAPSGEIQVLDQLSEHGTAIRRVGSTEEEVLCGDKSALEHGDMVRFGHRSFVVCVVSRFEE